MTSPSDLVIPFSVGRVEALPADYWKRKTMSNERNQMTTKTKRKLMPAILFYTGDWLKDPAVRCISLAARGLWIDMLCLMYESPTRGYLSLLDGKPVSAVQLARMVGGTLKEIESLLSEMRGCGTYSVTDDGVMFSRRMVADEELRELKSKAGKASGRARKKGNTIATEGQQNANTMPTPLEYEDEDEHELVLHNSSTNYLEQREARIQGNAEVELVVSAIPKNRLRNPAKTRVAIEHALDRANVDRGTAAQLLAERIAAYYNSSEGQGEYFKDPHNWLDEDCHLADPSTWDARKKTGTTGWDAMP